MKNKTQQLGGERETEIRKMHQYKKKKWVTNKEVKRITNQTEIMKDRRKEM